MSFILPMPKFKVLLPRNTSVSATAMGRPITASIKTFGPAGPPGSPGPAGPPGASGDEPLTYAISGVANYAAAHGKPYAPEVWILDTLGETVEADVVHTPGLVTVSFAAPFTGTLIVR